MAFRNAMRKDDHTMSCKNLRYMCSNRHEAVHKQHNGRKHKENQIFSTNNTTETNTKRLRDED